MYVFVKLRVRGSYTMSYDVRRERVEIYVTRICIS